MSRHRGETSDSKSKPSERKLFEIVPEEYLDRFGVTAYLKDVVTLLLENRPENPIEFISDYFTNVIQGSSSIVRSYRHVRLTRRNRHAFMDNLVAAYQTLEARRSVTGADLIKLVKLLCIDFPSSILTRVLQVLGCREGSVVNFPEFVGAMRTLLAYEEFLSEAEQLFHTLDTEKTGKVSRSTYKRLLSEVEKADVAGDSEIPTVDELQKLVAAALAPAPSADESSADQDAPGTPAAAADDLVSFDDYLRGVFRAFLPVEALGAAAV